MIDVVVLEDNDLLRNRLADILSSWSYVKSISAYSNNKDTIAHIDNNSVDVLLADLNVEDGSGNASISYLKSKYPSGLPIVISALSDGKSVIRAIEAGAVGYLHKEDSSFEIKAAIITAINGESPMSPSIARQLISSVNLGAASGMNTYGFEEVFILSEQEILTPREVEVLKLIAKGLSYAECGQSLNISEKTVPVHVRNIYAKLHAKNRSEAVFEARAMGVIL